MRSKGINIELMTRQRERDIQKQLDEVKIRKAKYNPKYNEISIELESPKYLCSGYMDINKEGLGDEIRALLKLRCGNLEEENKYWKEEKEKICKFCSAGKDNVEHFVSDCKVKDWFEELGESIEERLKNLWDDKLNKTKGKILIRLMRQKEKQRDIRILIMKSRCGRIYKHV